MYVNMGIISIMFLLSEMSIHTHKSHCWEMYQMH